MATGRRNAIRDIALVLDPLEGLMQPLGFTRDGHLFHRQLGTGADARIQGLSFRFEYGFRTCWLHVTVKFPCLIELLSQVRPFAYANNLAWRVPDFDTHLACRLRLEDLRPLYASDLPVGIRWRDDSRLQRTRAVPAEVLGGAMCDLVQTVALSVLENRLTLTAVAAASDSAGYTDTGIAGAWTLAARLVLGDLDGAASAFRRHPLSLGADFRRFKAAKAWLLQQHVDVAGVDWPESRAAVEPRWNLPTWLTGSLLP